MTINELQVAFETWFTSHYEWYIVRKRRGYSLDVVEGEYYWDIPKSAFVAFKGAMIMTGAYQE